MNKTGMFEFILHYNSYWISCSIFMGTKQFVISHFQWIVYSNSLTFPFHSFPICREWVSWLGTPYLPSPWISMLCVILFEIEERRDRYYHSLISFWHLLCSSTISQEITYTYTHTFYRTFRVWHSKHRRKEQCWYMVEFLPFIYSFTFVILSQE